MTGISRLALTQTLADQLHLIDGLTIYRGEVDPQPPTLDDSGRVAPYAVIYPSPGTPDPGGRDAADTWTDLDWVVQITVAAGYQDDLLAAVDDVDEVVHGWAPVIDGCSCAPLRPPPGYDPGPARRDNAVTPPRHYLPLQYRLTATT